MGTESFNLKWNDFESNFSETFSSLRAEEKLLDVSLVCEDLVEVSAHQLVLCAGSSYFRRVLSLAQNKHPNPLLCLQGVKARNLQTVLDYIYNGEVQLPQTDLEPFLSLAQSLQLGGLSKTDKPPTYQDFPPPENNRVKKERKKKPKKVPRIKVEENAGSVTADDQQIYISTTGDTKISKFAPENNTAKRNRKKKREKLLRRKFEEKGKAVEADEQQTYISTTVDTKISEVAPDNNSVKTERKEKGIEGENVGSVTADDELTNISTTSVDTTNSEVKTERKKKRKKLLRIKWEEKAIEADQQTDISAIGNSKILEVEENILKNIGKREDGMYYCLYCEKENWHRGHMKNHVESHMEGLSYSCEKCGKIFGSRNSIQSHNSQVHREEIQSVKKSDQLTYDEISEM